MSYFSTSQKKEAGAFSNAITVLPRCCGIIFTYPVSFSVNRDASLWPLFYLVKNDLTQMSEFQALYL